MKKLPLVSHSAANDYKSCAELNYLKRVLRIRCKEQGASLNFGIAVDVALSYLLEQKKADNEKEGLENLQRMFLDGKQGWESAFDDMRLRYRRADYDASLIALHDTSSIVKGWEAELKTNTKDALQAEYQKKYKKFEGKHLQMFNRLCWLSLKYKGKLMIDAFLSEVYPKIKKVIAVQHRVEGEVEGVARIVGYIDLICEYEGYDTPVVLDIKTSSSFYDDHSVQFSEQLLLYMKAVGEELETETAGFIVLMKAMKKKELCAKCGFARSSKHRTCNAEVDGERCGGAWSGIPEGQTQVVIDQLPKEKQDDYFEGFKEVAILAAKGIRYKNLKSCFNYGMCDFFHLCHYGDKSNYIFPKNEEKEEKK